MALHISPEVEKRVNALAEGAGREPDALASELLDAAVVPLRNGQARRVIPALAGRHSRPALSARPHAA